MELNERLKLPYIPMSFIMPQYVLGNELISAVTEVHIAVLVLLNENWI